MTDSKRHEWDAARYHQVATPHVGWGRTVLDRLPLRGDETVVDAGCGSGRLTRELLGRLPRGKVIAVDVSASMLAQASDNLVTEFGDRVSFVQSDLLELELPEPVDAIFSTAALHWVLDHDALFDRFFSVLKPGGWLVAQCGGGDNIGNLLREISVLAEHEPWDRYFADWPGPWEFADDVTTRRRLESAGFVEIETWLESSPVSFGTAEAYRTYLKTVVLGAHLARLDDATLRDRFLDELTVRAAKSDPPFTLDYWRLNLQGHRTLTTS